jgi:hypothetical protein
MFESPVLDMGGDPSAFSSGAISFSGGCEADMMNLYAQTYYPFLRKTCGNCHTNGPGIGQFGHPDFTTSYNAFKSMSRPTVNRNIINASHQPPYTGPQNQGTMDSFTPRWDSAEITYGACTGNAVAGSGIITLGKSNAAIIAAANNPNTFTRVTWDLMSELKDSSLRGKIPLTVGIDVRVATINGERQGYEFRNPTVKINTGFTGPFRVTSLRIYINSSMMQNLTTYSTVDFSISSNTDTNISPGTALALAVTSPIQDTDSFAVEIGDIKNSTGGSIGNPGGTTPTQTLPTSVTYAQLMSNDATLGIFRQSCVSCHSGADPKGGFDITSFAQAKQQANDIYSRMNNLGNPMPKTGLLLIDKREIVRIWRDTGAN